MAMPHFSIQALKVRELGEAWPVVRATACHPSPDWWMSDAAETIEAGGGVLVARAPDGGIHGVATYKVPPACEAERTLVIPTLITFELSRSAPVRAALLEALGRIAGRLGCGHVALPLSAKS
jgi:hypothetical protein